MDLTTVVIGGVGLSGDSTRVGDRSLVQVTLDILLKKKSDDSITSKYRHCLGLRVIILYNYPPKGR